MLVPISGGRGDGTEWPRVGEEIDVGDEEGRHLCQAQLAVPVPVEAPLVEKAVPPTTADEPRTAPSATRARKT